MPRRRKVNLSINHERWLISYSDFITLLFAFFVVMYSISQVNESKYRVLSDTLKGAFNVSTKAISPIQVGDLTRTRDPSIIERDSVSKRTRAEQGAFDKMADLPQLSQQVNKQLADLIDDKLVQVNSNEFWLQIELKSSILFPSASAIPSDQAKIVFDALAQIFKGMDNPIQVEGFTDDQPIHSQYFPSNWELSGARAAATVKLLIDSGVKPQQLSAVGYGEYQPIARNDSAEGRAQNRRVVLMIAREKIERPAVSADNQLIEAAKGGEFLQSEPYPQPEGEKSTDQARLDDLIIQHSEPDNPTGNKFDQLDILLKNKVDLVKGDGAGKLQNLDDIRSIEGHPKEPSETQLKSKGENIVKPVELKDGGLLFSSDPDLPRNE